jgi:CBS domain-containing protein
VSLEVPATAVEAALRSLRVRHLPVAGERGLIGVVSLEDLARFYALRERAGRADETVAPGLAPAHP